MKTKYKFIILALLALDFALILSILIGNNPISVLDPKGLIAAQQKSLFVNAILLMLIVVVPVFLFAIYVVMNYREGNTKSKYTPDWDHDIKIQLAWWALPTTIIFILCIIMWNATFKWEPHSPIQSDKKEMTIQVVALRWKWLFIYPEQGIATVNYITIPEKTPIKFVLTADEAPMNSFWVPRLGGQLYAMSGMVNRLNLIADETGVYYGSNAEISGKGFAGMRFTVKSVSQNDFDTWITSVKQSSKALTREEYKVLTQPTEDNPPVFYSSTADNLFSTIIMKYQAPANSGGHKMPTSEAMPGKHGMEH